MDNSIKAIVTFAFLFLASLAAAGQKTETYLNHADEVQEKHTIYTEVIINAQKIETQITAHFIKINEELRSICQP